MPPNWFWVAGELAKQSERLKQEVESFLATVRAA